MKKGKKRRKGQGKGQAFERETCVKLSEWISKGTRRDLLWRTAMSGGRATLGAKRGQKHRSQSGDISAIDPLGARLTEYFCIECKFYADLNLTGMWFGRGFLYDVWTKERVKAQSFGKEPMVIAKQNFQETLVLISAKSALATASFTRWTNGEVAVGLFDEMLRVPYVVPVVVERWRSAKR
jgi:hypothetical protein